MARRMKRSLSLLLALVMCLSLVNISAFAAGGSDWQIGSYAGYDAQTGEANGESYTSKENATQNLEADGVTMQKNISATATENQFNIELIVTTQEQLSEIPLSPDAAVVLVIDASNSMNYNDNGCSEYCYYYGHKDAFHEGTTYRGAWPIEFETRLPKAKTAAINFVDDFVEGAGEASRMISVVSFNGDAKTEIGWTESNVNLNAIGWGDDIEDVKNAIKNISTDSDTNIEDGLQRAYDLLGQESVRNIKSRYVILLTDGAPTTSNQWGSN